MVGLVKLIVAMSVIFLAMNSNDSIKSIGLVVTFTSIVIVPYSFFYTLKYLVILGKSPLFHMKDSDFQDLVFIADIISKYFSTPDHHDDDDIDKEDMKVVDSRITLTSCTNSNRRKRKQQLFLIIE